MRDGSRLLAGGRDARRPHSGGLSVSRATVTPRKDEPTVTPDGEPLEPRIEGRVVRWARGIEDKRREIVEIYRPSWGLHPDPLAYVYQSSLHPGAIKGWVCHRLQDDRLFMITGALRWAFFDDRPESPTRARLNVITFSERNRALVIVPRGVYHAVENVGADLAIFINLPTRPYDHGDPDKYRLPLKNDLIPFDFDDGPGW
jgi:dTDP-4-dehydrorhamnose 3,5-epimerase